MSQDYVRLHRAELITLRGGKCEYCGSSDRLEFAHVGTTGLKGMGRGSYARLKDVTMHPDKYRLLCHNCHVRYDGAMRYVLVIPFPYTPEGHAQAAAAHNSLKAVVQLKVGLTVSNEGIIFSKMRRRYYA